MPRGRFWYRPGFWKGPDWQPGAGGFRGGWYGRGPGWGPGWGYGWGPCHCRPPEFDYGPAFSGPEDEKSFLKDQQEQLKEELAAIEQRLDELEKET